MKKIENVVFICGAGGDAGMTYVPKLKEFCEENGLHFFAPHMPSFEDGITYKKYEMSFENTAKRIEPQHTLVVAQSVGTNFFVKYFASNPGTWGGVYRRFRFFKTA